ncbi:hypothetical protein ABIB99_008839 [Bradyrhizobium sp. LA6.1]
MTAKLLLGGDASLVSRWFDEETILRLGALVESESTVWDQHPVLM